MNELLTSASKLVLIMMAFTVCAAFLMRILSTEDFKLIAVMVFTYYFTNKGNTEKPYGGK